MSMWHKKRRTARRHSIANNRKTSSIFRRSLQYEPLEDRRLLAVVTVTTLGDTINFNDGVTSLREAIFATNTVPGADTINFAPSLTFNGPGTILLTQGELKITDSLTINGSGASLLTIDASGNDPTPEQNNRDGIRVFNINDGKSFSRSDVTLVGLTLTGGDVSTGGAITSSENLILVDSAVTGNFAATGGGMYMGGFSSSSGSLTITRSVIQNNSAGGRGGGVFARAPASTITILDSQFLGNIAGTNGGGLCFEGSRGQVVVTDSEFSNNTAGQNGGGMIVTGATTTINTTAVHNNYAGRGGGGLAASNLIVSNSSIIGNSANSGFATVVPSGGGGISAGNFVITGTTISGNSSKSTGGGVFSLGTSTITDCIITDNSATVGGGGIYLGIGNLTVTSSAIRGNSASAGGGIASNGPLVVANSAISGNSANGYSTFYRNGGGIWCSGSLLVSGTTISSNSSTYDGGGIWAGSNANVTITNSTLSGNSAAAGGGAWVTSGANIRHSTITSNSAQILGGGLFTQSGTLQLQHSIVGSNSAPVGREATGLIGSAIVPSNSLISWNAESGLAESPAGSSDANGNLIGGLIHGFINGHLGTLADNGGTALPDGTHAFTHAHLSGSPAINAGDPAAMAGSNGVPLHDQRGAPFTRVYGGRIDIGAFESQPANYVLGDSNRDGVVDASDYTLWRKQTGSTVTPGTGSDANGDGLVNDADLVVWRSNYGRTWFSPAPLAMALQENREVETAATRLPEQVVALAVTDSRMSQPITRTPQAVNRSLGQPSHFDSGPRAWLASAVDSNRPGQPTPRVSQYLDVELPRKTVETEDSIDAGLDELFAALGVAKKNETGLILLR